MKIFRLSRLSKVLFLISALLTLMMTEGRAAEISPSVHPFLNTSLEPHQVRLIDNDISALENLLELIQRAKSSIDLEYFVFDPDHAGRLVLQALVKKAREGIKIRILVDYNANGLKPGLDRFYRDQLEKEGIQLRYFNVADFIEIWKVGFRNHRKMLVVDDREMVMGGRNIADAYFGMSHKMNYQDRDVWVRGPIVRDAVTGFDLFWNDPVVKNPKQPQQPFGLVGNPSSSKLVSSRVKDRSAYQHRLDAFNAQIEETGDSLHATPEDEILLRRVALAGQRELAQSPVLTIHSITLVSDRPIPGEGGRVVTPYLWERIEKADKSVFIENFLFLVKGLEKRTLLGLSERGVKIDILTNGFGSDPNDVMAELANSRQCMAVEHGMNVYCYRTAPALDRKFCGSEVTWGLHTKTMVIDEKDSIIGSYNLDPRSARINDEGLVVINDSPAFAKLVEEKTWERVHAANSMTKDGSYADSSEHDSAIRIITIILRPLAETLTDFL